MSRHRFFFRPLRENIFHVFSSRAATEKEKRKKEKERKYRILCVSRIHALTSRGAKYLMKLISSLASCGRHQHHDACAPRIHAAKLPSRLITRSGALCFARCITAIIYFVLRSSPSYRTAPADPAGRWLLRVGKARCDVVLRLGRGRTSGVIGARTAVDNEQALVEITQRLLAKSMLARLEIRIASGVNSRKTES